MSFGMFSAKIHDLPSLNKTPSRTFAAAVATQASTCRNTHPNSESVPSASYVSPSDVAKYSLLIEACLVEAPVRVPGTLHDLCPEKLHHLEHELTNDGPFLYKSKLQEGCKCQEVRCEHVQGQVPHQSQAPKNGHGCHGGQDVDQRKGAVDRS